MIYPDYMLYWWARDHVKPFDSDCINPASIDLRLGREFIKLHREPYQFEGDRLIIYPGEAFLATTMEYIEMPTDAAGVVYLKSSLARSGLDHALAGWVDPGFHGELTLELHAHKTITLRAGQRVLQLVLMKMADAPVSLYDGRYQGQRGPTEARPVIKPEI